MNVDDEPWFFAVSSSISCCYAKANFPVFTDQGASKRNKHSNSQTLKSCCLEKNSPKKKTEMAVKNLAKENRNVNKLFATLNAAADGTSRMLFQMAVEGKLRAYDTIMHTASSLL